VTTVTLEECDATPAYVTVSTASGVPIMTFSTYAASLVDTHTITVIYQLTRYISVTTSFTMTVHIC
jgi:hypothetical protein